MRNKLICLLSIYMIFSSVVSADEINSSTDWGTLSGAENAWDGQKIIKPGDYDAVVNELEKRKNAKKIKANKKAGQALMKGTEASEHDFLSNFVEQYPLLNLTVPIKTSAGEIPTGHYKVIGVKKNGKVTINLCHAYDVVGKFPAIETEDDFNSEEINFVKIEPVAENVLKLMYGSMKFNAYAYLTY